MIFAILQAGRDGLPITEEMVESHAAARASLIELGAVEERDGAYWMTPEALSYCSFAQAISRPSIVADVREELTLDKLSTYELLMKMFGAKWELVQVESASQKKHPPYKKGGVLLSRLFSLNNACTKGFVHCFK